MTSIALHLDGKFHSMRKWSAVPRMNEYVFVDIDGVAEMRWVVQVQWGVTEQSRRGDVNDPCDVIVVLGGRR